MIFALISEGPSEHRIIKHIISRYLKDFDPIINQIQPKLVEGKQDDSTPGGWNEVLKYCGREDLEDIMVENEYLIIQIDTDMCETEPFGISHTEEGEQKSEEQLFEDVRKKLIGLIKEDIRNNYDGKIIFAICMHTIECWLIPIFISNKKGSKKVNCINQLNKELRRADIQIINGDNKNKANGIKAYEAILANWKKRKDIEKSASYSFGFKHFIDSLKKIDEEE